MPVVRTGGRAAGRTAAHRVVGAFVAVVAGLGASIVSTGTPAGAATPQVTVYAHRGGAGLAPENTLGAFRQTHAQFGSAGVWLELDTQLTADGHLVVLHDDTLDRTTNCAGPVIHWTLAELSDCDAGEAFPGWSAFEPVPTLRDVLVEGRDAGWRLMIELKDIIGEANFDITGTLVADALVRLVREVGFPLDRLLVQSFWPLAIDRIEATLPGARTVFLTSSSLPGLPGIGIPAVVNVVLSALRGYEVTSPASDSIDLSAGVVAVAHLLGRQVVPYTPNTHPEIDRVVAMGVDGVITDHPERAYEVLG